jgi:hypothetical protein
MAISRGEYGVATENPPVSWTRGEEARLVKAARLVIDLYGTDAASYAVTRAALLRNMGDAPGATAWQRVAPIIEKLQRNAEVASPS